MSSGVETFVLDNANDNNHQQHAPYHDQQVTRMEASTMADMDSYSQSSSFRNRKDHGLDLYFSSEKRQYSTPTEKRQYSTPKNDLIEEETRRSSHFVGREDETADSASSRTMSSEDVSATTNRASYVSVRRMCSTLHPYLTASQSRQLSLHRLQIMPMIQQLHLRRSLKTKEQMNGIVMKLACLESYSSAVDSPPFVAESTVICDTDAVIQSQQLTPVPLKSPPHISTTVHSPPNILPYLASLSIIGLLTSIGMSVLGDNFVSTIKDNISDVTGNIGKGVDDMNSGIVGIMSSSVFGGYNASGKFVVKQMHSLLAAVVGTFLGTESVAGISRWNMFQRLNRSNTEVRSHSYLTSWIQRYEHSNLRPIRVRRGR
jgi:hypothetical protein